MKQSLREILREFDPSDKIEAWAYFKLWVSRYIYVLQNDLTFLRKEWIDATIDERGRWVELRDFPKTLENLITHTYHMTIEREGLSTSFPDHIATYSPEGVFFYRTGDSLNYPHIHHIVDDLSLHSMPQSYYEHPWAGQATNEQLNNLTILLDQ